MDSILEEILIWICGFFMISISILPLIVYAVIAIVLLFVFMEGLLLFCVAVPISLAISELAISSPTVPLKKQTATLDFEGGYFCTAKNVSTKFCLSAVVEESSFWPYSVLHWAISLMPMLWAISKWAKLHKRLQYRIRFLCLVMMLILSLFILYGLAWALESLFNCFRVIYQRKNYPIIELTIAEKMLFAIIFLVAYLIHPLCVKIFESRKKLFAKLKNFNIIWRVFGRGIYCIGYLVFIAFHFFIFCILSLVFEVVLFHLSFFFIFFISNQSVFEEARFWTIAILNWLITPLLQQMAEKHPRFSNLMKERPRVLFRMIYTLWLASPAPLMFFAGHVVVATICGADHRLQSCPLEMTKVKTILLAVSPVFVYLIRLASNKICEKISKSFTKTTEKPCNDSIPTDNDHAPLLSESEDQNRVAEQAVLPDTSTNESRYTDVVGHTTLGTQTE